MRLAPSLAAVAAAAILALMPDSSSAQRRPAPATPDDGRGAGGAPVTLAVVNARVWTGDPRRPWADAVAAAGERIVAVGSSAAVRKMAPAGARVVDARGAMLVPGFVDAHVHFVDGGFRLASVQLRDARTPAEFVRRIAAFVGTVPKGTWITGGD